MKVKVIIDKNGDIAQVRNNLVGTRELGTMAVYHVDTEFQLEMLKDFKCRVADAELKILKEKKKGVKNKQI